MAFGVAWSMKWGHLQIAELELFLIFADIIDFRYPSICTVNS
jgi:hypothetical protein